MKNTYEDLREMVDKELREITKRGELDDMSLEHTYKLVDIAKDICEIEEKESGYSERYMGYPYMMEGGSSRAGRYSREGYSRDGYSRDGYSMRQGRDSMGRYSRDYSNNSYRGYSRDGEEM